MRSARFRNPDHLTAAELGAFLGLAASSVRALIHREGIEPVAKEGRAHLYDARAFVDKVEGHDRRYLRKRRGPVQQ
jgi:hypothetical protein